MTNIITIEHLTHIIEKYTSFDFSEELPVNSGNQEMDALAKALRELKQKLVALNKASQPGYKLIQSQDRFRALIENSNDILSLYDASFNAIYRSPSAARISGWDADVMEDLNIFEMIHPDDAENSSSLMKEILENPGKNIHLDLRVKHRNGHYLWINGMGVNLLHNKDINAIVINVRDITPLKQKEMELETTVARFKKAKKLAHMAYWELDLKTNIVKWADEFYRILGLEPGAVAPTREALLERIHPDDRQYTLEVINNARQHYQPFSMHYRIIQKNTGAIRNIQATGKYETDSAGNPVIFYGTIIDITELSDKKEALKNAHKELETFIYKSSHDLRGPLASILGLSNLAKLDVKDETALSYFSNIGAQAQKMDKSIFELVRIMSIKDRKPVLESINLLDMAHDVLKALEYTEGFSKTKFEIDNTLSGPIQSDREFIYSILLNLIENSVKYGNYSGLLKPRIYISFAPDLHHNVCIVIKDNGTGMNEATREQAFDMFYRGNTRTKGTGLGLYIVKKTVDRLGGSISLESSENSGSEFRIVFPNNG